jgi:hypothetical protein
MFPARATLSFAVSLREEGQVELLGRRPTDLAQLQNLNYAEKGQEPNFLQFSAVAVRVHNRGRAPFAIHCRNASPTPTCFAKIVSDLDEEY